MLKQKIINYFFTGLLSNLITSNFSWDMTEPATLHTIIVDDVYKQPVSTIQNDIILFSVSTTAYILMLMITITM